MSMSLLPRDPDRTAPAVDRPEPGASPARTRGAVRWGVATAGAWLAFAAAVTFLYAHVPPNPDQALYDEMGFWLGIGIACLVTLFDPTVVVLGGGMMAAGELLLRPTRQSLAEHVYARSNRQLPSLCQAKTGSHAVAVGAALLAFDAARSSR